MGISWDCEWDGIKDIFELELLRAMAITALDTFEKRKRFTFGEKTGNGDSSDFFTGEWCLSTLLSQ